jgi:hypothetical protein
LTTTPPTLGARFSTLFSCVVRAIAGIITPALQIILKLVNPILNVLDDTSDVSFRERLRQHWRQSPSDHSQKKDLAHSFHNPTSRLLNSIGKQVDGLWYASTCLQANSTRNSVPSREN